MPEIDKTNNPPTSLDNAKLLVQLCRVSNGNSDYTGDAVLHDELDGAEHKSGDFLNQDPCCEICLALQMIVHQLQRNVDKYS